METRLDFFIQCIIILIFMRLQTHRPFYCLFLSLNVRLCIYLSSSQNLVPVHLSVLSHLLAQLNINWIILLGMCVQANCKTPLWLAQIILTTVELIKQEAIVIVMITSAPLGHWKCKFLASFLEIMTDRPTNRRITSAPIGH